jgi:hypothetical protein
MATAVALGVCSGSYADAPAVAAPSATKIWECTTKGVRTFSSNPCGTNPTVRELSPINVMEPAPVPMYRVTHTYAPAQTTQSPDTAYSNQPATDAVSTDGAYNGYPGYVVVTRSHRVRQNSARNHPHPHH